MSLADLLARANAMFARHEAQKAVEPPPPPAPKGPRVCRIAEAKQGAQWVEQLTPEQRAAAGIADDWRTQALADLEAIGGVPPAPPHRIGRPRKTHAPIEAPAGLVRELAGEADVFDAFMPTPPVRRQRADEDVREATAGGEPESVEAQAGDASPAVVLPAAHRRPVQIVFDFFSPLRGVDSPRAASRRGLSGFHLPAGADRQPRAGPGPPSARPGTGRRTPNRGKTWTSSSDNHATEAAAARPPPPCSRSG